MPQVLFFLVVIGIPVTLGIGFAAFERWLKHKEHMAKALSAEAGQQVALLAAQNERLEQRVRVLERIATDRGADLAGQIEQLRDPPGTDGRALRHDAQGVTE